MAATCLACEKGVPKRGRRRCPLCGQAFRSGWEGIETHWRAKHAAALPYERFWSSLCRDHRAGARGRLPVLPQEHPAQPQVAPPVPGVRAGVRGPRLGRASSRTGAPSHPDVMPYEDFFASLCPAHRGGGDTGTDYLPLGER